MGGIFSAFEKAHFFMACKSTEILLLKAAIQQSHNCNATHYKTVLVHEKFQGETLWHGEVEVFEVSGHPKATRCFAWLGEEEGKGVRPVAILAHGRVNSPEAAVNIAIVLGLPLKPDSSQPPKPD